jgi:pyrroloquinoline quinone biosynthesis protein B
MAACLAIVDGTDTGSQGEAKRWLVDTTPDLRDQLHLLDGMVPAGKAPVPALDGIIITHGHVGHYLGLALLGREVMDVRGLPVLVMPRMASLLQNGAPWNQLVEQGNILIEELEAGQGLELIPGVVVIPMEVPHRAEYTETIGLVIEGPLRKLLYIPDIDDWDTLQPPLVELLSEVDLALLDGTFYDAAELAGRDRSEIGHPNITETMELLRSVPASQRAKVRFIHLNHSNPLCSSDSEQRKSVEAFGCGVVEEGDRFALG